MLCTYSWRRYFVNSLWIIAGTEMASNWDGPFQTCCPHYLKLTRLVEIERAVCKRVKLKPNVLNTALICPAWLLALIFQAFASLFCLKAVTYASCSEEYKPSWNQHIFRAGLFKELLIFQRCNICGGLVSEVCWSKLCSYKAVLELTKQSQTLFAASEKWLFKRATLLFVHAGNPLG